MIPITNLKQIPLFTYLPDDALEHIQQTCRERQFERGQSIFAEGEVAENLYVLEKGTVAIRMAQTPDSDSVMVAALRDKGVLFGWSAVIGPGRFTASAVCMDDVTVIEVDGRGLRQLIHEDCETGVVILTALANVIAARLQATRVQLIGAPVVR
jgi:CRP-like cAMP-binding protein